MINKIFQFSLTLICVLFLTSCDVKTPDPVKIIKITTEHGEFNVWTKRTGNNPTKKVLLLHGGPGANHQYFKIFDSYFPNEDIEYYYYDQLGSTLSDNPQIEDLWTIEHYVDEVEQVRKSLGLNKDNFILLGHSWGGILGIEYALKYQKNLKALIVSNMVPSVPDYNNYAKNVLALQLDQDVLKQIRSYEAVQDYTNENYLKLIHDNYYPKHVMRIPAADWPEDVSNAFAEINFPIYLKMQGPSEFGIVGDASLKNWDVTDDLKKLEIPFLSIGAKYDTMDPIQMEWMANEVQNGFYLNCPNGSHMAMWDDTENYFNGLINFINNL
ncbi:proline iminopeptidase-family hydrolase [Flavobacteriaceae bacterium]|nr:proline iminopeptidase-family hydrolase [Flavobacteriaceae bacterium]MDA9257054.1 proline iminopeptidase-family hydrolase [Flavobacteriaceae bacterium]MDA9373743.1 proline iminopeptidase-family hydrolase [Flavobacteriaceae bacterium]MDB4006013.1 proline iminopeptidase-family hydrolase [Flavobacteriaceae bacterium]MDB4013775.1 proline iminopeptidase-family hydrolase [Flavobacteriaceae bacterium]